MIQPTRETRPGQCMYAMPVYLAACAQLRCAAIRIAFLLIAEIVLRIALGIEYDGTDFLGWQRLSHGSTVQGALESALGFVANHPVIRHLRRPYGFRCACALPGRAF
jgi:hypothetical protein